MLKMGSLVDEKCAILNSLQNHYASKHFRIFSDKGKNKGLLSRKFFKLYSERPKFGQENWTDLSRINVA